MDQCFVLLMEAEELINEIEPINMLSFLTESSDDEEKKMAKNKKATEGALAKIKKAIMFVVNAIKSFVKSFAASVKKMFASKETKYEFEEWEAAMKQFPEFRHKKLTFLDYEKYKKQTEAAAAKVDKLANTHGTTQEEMNAAVKELEEAVNDEPTKEMELGDVVGFLKGQAVDACQDIAKSLTARAAEAATDAGKLGIDITAEMAKDPHNALRAAGYAAISHRGFAAAYQKEAMVSNSWIARGFKEVRRNLKDIGTMIATTGKTDEVSRTRRAAAKKNVQAMFLKSKGTSKIAGAVMDVRDVDGKLANRHGRAAAADQLEMTAGALNTKAAAIHKKNQVVKGAKNVINTVGSMFGSLKESVRSVPDEDDE